MNRIQNPPSGMSPPRTADLSNGVTINLVELAAIITDKFTAAHPGEAQHYGLHYRAWCTHDNQYLLFWAVQDSKDEIVFVEQLRWLAGVLRARSYSIEHLAEDLEIAAEVIDDHAGGAAQAVSEALRNGALVLAREG